MSPHKWCIDSTLSTLLWTLGRYILEPMSENIYLTMHVTSSSCWKSAQNQMASATKEDTFVNYNIWTSSSYLDGYDVVGVRIICISDVRAILKTFWKANDIRTKWYEIIFIKKLYRFVLVKRLIDLYLYLQYPNQYISSRVAMKINHFKCCQHLTN